MANNRVSVLPAPPGPAPPTSEGVFVDRSWSARWMPTRPVCARPLILDGKVRAQSRKAGGQAAWPQLTPTGGLLRGGPQRPKLPGSPTFDDVCVFQRQLPQQLVFAGRVDDAGCRVPVGATGCSARAGEWARGGTTAPTSPAAPTRPHPATHRLMELRRREPDFRFRVVQTMRSVNRKRDRSFLPPTAFCGARGRIQAEAHPPAHSAPGTARPREG